MDPTLTLLRRFLPFGTLFLLGCACALANSTSFNGFVQSSGDNGVDFGNLGGGNYRITMTSNGQINFRYSLGGQTYDSNPEAAVVDLTATTSGPATYGGTSAVYDATAVIQLLAPLPGQPSSYKSSFQFTSSTLPALFLSRMSLDSGSPKPGATQFNFQGNSFSATGSILDNTFNYAPISSNYVPLSSATMVVPPTSLIAQSDPALMSGIFTNGLAFVAAENPEPGTFFLMGGALLAGLAMRRRWTRS